MRKDCFGMNILLFLWETETTHYGELHGNRRREI
jgi:hypothetical protein